MFGFFGLHIIRHAFARSIRGGVFILWRPPPAAMQVDVDQSHQQWVSRVKLRMPRHISEIDEQEEVPLVECRTWPAPQRWYEAHKAEIQRWRENRRSSVLLVEGA